MKRPSSIRRELTLLSRSYYFYVEVGMAVLYLALLLIVMPENLSPRTTAYYHFDMPQALYETLESVLLPGSGIVKSDTTLTVRGQKVQATHYATDTQDVYRVASLDSLKALTEDKGATGLSLSFEGGEIRYHYYLQGYETERFKNLATLMSSSQLMALTQQAKDQPVRVMSDTVTPLTSRQSLLVMLLVVNGAMMGVFIMAALIFEDKKTRVISALKVTPRPVSHYLAAKMAATLLLSLLSALIITVPVMGLRPHYPLLLLVTVTSGLFMLALGALIASFFADMEGAFAAVFITLIVFLIPAIGHMLPSFRPLWLMMIPSFWAIEATQNALMNIRPMPTLWASAGFLAGGLILFHLSVWRFKKGGQSV